MSRTVDIVVSTTGVLGASGGVGIIALGIGAAAYGAYSVLKGLRDDYQQGLQEFHQRAQEEEQTRQTLSDQQREDQEQAQVLIAQTKVNSTLNANTVFLQHRVQQLQSRLTGELQEKLQARCEELVKDIARTPHLFSEHLEAYRRLSESASDAGKYQGAAGIAGEIAALREEILSPVLEAPAVAEARQQLLTQLDALEAVGKRQILVARQGLTLLRQRVYREIQTRVEEQQARARRVEEARALTGDIYAKLQALAAVGIADINEKIEELRKWFSEILAQGETGEMDPLRRLAQQTNELFAACENLLQEELTASYIRDQVSDVLLSLGYQVQQISEGGAEQKLVTQIDGELGIEFHLDGTGHLGTEMVGLHDGATAGEEEQEKICRIVDEVIEALHQRNLTTRERFRTSSANDSLRIIDVPPQEEPAQQTTPNQQRMNQS